MNDEAVLPDVLGEFLDAVIRLDLEGVMATYADDVCRTSSGPDWFYHGIEDTRKEWIDWIETSPARYTEFRWLEGPYGELGDKLGWAAGVWVQDYELDGKITSQHCRVSWVFRKEESGWKILMDHYSRPMAEPYSPENAVAQYKPPGA